MKPEWKTPQLELPFVLEVCSFQARHGLSTSAVAVIFGVKLNTLYSWLSGRSRPNDANKDKVFLEIKKYENPEMGIEIGGCQS